MKHLLPILSFFVLSVAGAFAQNSVSVTPGTFVLTGQPSETDVYYYINVTNTSPNDIGVHWARTVTGAPANWLSWICDKNLCYIPQANQSSPTKPNMLAPGETMQFQIHVNPGNVIGSADYEVVLTDMEDPNLVLATITGDVLIGTTSTNQPSAGSGLTVFPNPTTDYFQISDTPGLRYVEVYNIVGSRMRSFDAVPQKQYFIGDLNEGVYLVRLISGSGKVIKTIRLSKR